MLRSLFLTFYFIRFIYSSEINYDDWSVDENALFPSLPIAAPYSENEQCREDSRLLVAHLKNKTFWAMQMWDASAKTDFGLLYGNVYQAGNFDECMLVKKPIEAQFCGATMRAFVKVANGSGDPYDLDPDSHAVVWKKFEDSRIDPSKYPRDNVTWGLCVPASCSWKDMYESINRRLQDLNSKASENDPKYTARVNDKWHCTKRERLEYTWSEILFWSTTAWLVLLQIIAAIFDRNEKNKLFDSKIGKLLLSFSIKRNLSHLFRMKSDPNQLKQLRILYGAKFLSVVFIVFDHRGGLTFASPIVNFQGYETFTRSAENLFVLHGDLVVDTFFFISGLLSCYALLEIYNRKYINPLFVIFGRWIRLAPLYYFMVWFHTDGIFRLGSGPIWNAALQPEAEKCKQNWWLNLLFLNNYFGVEDSCMIHSWFLSCEFQLFIICILFVLLITKNEKLGVSVLGVSIVVTALIPGIITYMYQLKPFILFYHDFLSDTRGGNIWKLLYVPTHARAAVYLVGMITGYIVFKTKDSSKRLPANCGGPLLILCLGLLFAPMAYGSLYYDPRRPYNVYEATIFAIFRRFSWALGCFVCMMVNCFGRNIFLITFSRTRLYLFLSKLTYSIYLLHFYMQSADIAKVRVPKYFSLYDVFVAGCGDLFLSLIYGSVLYLLVELPFKKFAHELFFARRITRIKSEIERQEGIKIKAPPSYDAGAVAPINGIIIGTEKNGAPNIGTAINGTTANKIVTNGISIITNGVTKNNKSIINGKVTPQNGATKLNNVISIRL